MVNLEFMLIVKKLMCVNSQFGFIKGELDHVTQQNNKVGNNKSIQRQILYKIKDKKFYKC